VTIFWKRLLLWYEERILEISYVWFDERRQKTVLKIPTPLFADMSSSRDRDTKKSRYFSYVFKIFIEYKNVEFAGLLYIFGIIISPRNVCGV